MVDESVTFGVATALMVGGLAVMLYGVSLNDGQSLNGVMLAGGTLVVVSIAITTAAIMAIDGSAHPE